MKDCLNCGNYFLFYTKDRDHFKKERQGICDLDRRIVENHDGCEKWRNNHWRRTVRKRICIKTVNKALLNLAEIGQN